MQEIINELIAVYEFIDDVYESYTFLWYSHFAD